MKHNRILCLILALVVLSTAVWYGSIAALQSGSQVTLKTVEGDPAALEGITLHGKLQDGSFAQNLTLENGQLNNRFDVTPSEPAGFSPYRYSGLVPLPAPDGHASKPEKLSSDPEWPVWGLSTDRVRFHVIVSQYSNEYGDRSALIDTGIEVQGKPDEFHFSQSINVKRPENYSPSGWYLSDDSFRTPGQFRTYEAITKQVGDDLYTAVNLPWGGAQLYRTSQLNNGYNVYADYTLFHLREEKGDPNYVFTTDEALALTAPTESYGTSELLTEFAADELTQIIGLYTLGDYRVVLARTDNSAPNYEVLPDGTLSPLESFEKNQLLALVYDQNNNLTDRAELMELPGDSSCQILLYQCVPADTGFEDLSLVFAVLAPYENQSSAPVRLMDGTVHLRVESGKLTAAQSASFPGNVYGQEPDCPVTDPMPRELAYAQPDETGTKLALVWRDPVAMHPDSLHFTGGDIYLEVFQGGSSLYRGLLDSDWKDDNGGEREINAPMFGFPRYRAFQFPMAEESPLIGYTSSGGAHQLWLY